MAGGMILLGVLLIYFDVATAHDAVLDHPDRRQRLARAAVAASSCCGRSSIGTSLGAVIAFAVMRTIAYVPDKAVVYLLLGADAVRDRSAARRRMRPNIEWRGVPFVTGILDHHHPVLAGVGGLFLDIFFQKSTLDRKTTNATKAVTQTFSHVVRWALFRLAGRHRQPAGLGLGAGDRAGASSARGSRPTCSSA